MADQGAFDGGGDFGGDGGGFEGYDDVGGYEPDRGAGAALDAYGRGVHDGHGVQAMVQEAMAPLLAQVTDMQIDRHAEALQEQFPQLTEAGTAEAFVAAATQMAASLGVDFHAVKMNPNFMNAAAAAFFGDAQGSGQQMPGGGPSIPEQIKGAQGGNRFWGT